jgi:hypothetical protein
MAVAVIDRVVHHGRLLQFRGESYPVKVRADGRGVLNSAAQVSCEICSKLGAISA